MHAPRRVVAQQGIATAQFILRLKYVTGEGVAKNSKEAVKRQGKWVIRHKSGKREVVIYKHGKLPPQAATRLKVQ